jgi:hypothetical protein
MLCFLFPASEWSPSVITLIPSLWGIFPIEFPENAWHNTSGINGKNGKK